MLETGSDIDIDLSNPDVFAERVPHDAFTRLRAEDPVYHNRYPEPNGFFALTKYDDIVKASRDYKTFSSSPWFGIEDPVDMLGTELMMLNMDPPIHTKLRMLVGKGFQPKAIYALEPHIREITKRIVDNIAARGECDFVTDVAAELPLEVIAELVGVPLDERHKIFEWSNRMMDGYGYSREDARQAGVEMIAYAQTLAEGRRENRRDDLISILVDAEVDGEKLNDIEIDVFFLLLMVAGNETTRNLISGGMKALIENPDQRERLMADDTLFDSAVEEMLRYVTPVMQFRRRATCDTEIRGVPIPAESKVVYWYVSGNRDEDVFLNPHQFDVGRDPNPHITFGAGGPHFCLGFNLAQLEIKVMFQELLGRVPDMQLAGRVERLRSHFINGIKHMPVRFTPETR
jgi:cholest-4-en-3-one 26-monooxygenase